MRVLADPLGKVLLRTGALTEELLADVLDQQRHTLPLGSLCYILGYLDEATLARVLARQHGVPSVVLDESIISLDILQGMPKDMAMRYKVLPIFEDERRIFFAAEAPESVPDPLRELGFMRGKTPVLHVALQVTLARTLRACYAARDRGDQFFYGPRAQVERAGETGYMVVVSDTQLGAGESVRVAPVNVAMVEDVTRELDSLEVRLDSEITGVEEMTSPSEQFDFSTGSTSRLPRFESEMTVTDVETAAPVLPELATSKWTEMTEERMDLDYLHNIEEEAEEAEPADGARPRHVLIVDDDFSTRHLLVKVLQPLGLTTSTAASGGEAIRQLKANLPDVVILDVMLPEMDGFQICQAIKQSRKYQHIAVILMSAVIDSGRVTEEVLDRYEAEAYFEKPIEIDLLKQRVLQLMRLPSVTPGAQVTGDDSFERAIELYKNGNLDGAVEVLRAGLDVDPLSAKHHFVLANLLQKKSLVYEAIDEYEATIDLKPDYFPALTRLAYLYYKQGFSAKAIEMWRRSLPHCSDASLRRNIETFMRRLISKM